MITFRGTALVATAIFTFFLARMTQVGWLYLLDSALWGIVLVSLGMPTLAVMSLQVSRRLARQDCMPSSPGPAEGDMVRIEMWVKNPRTWPRTFLSVGYSCPLASPSEEWQRSFVPWIARRSSLILHTTVECYRRGLHDLGPVTVESKAPFGLFRAKRRFDAPLSVLVYPQIHPIGGLPTLEGLTETTSRPRRARSGEDFSGSRHYFPGDPVRNIHWRNTARLGRPMVKEFEDSQENMLYIVFDSSQDLGEGRETVLEYSIKIVASVSAYANERGKSVVVLTGGMPGQWIPWAKLYTGLALLRVDHGPGLPELIAPVPLGAKLLALVSETDLSGVESLIRRTNQPEGLTVVMLEGFGVTQLPQNPGAKEALQRNSASYLRCPKGDLVGVLKSLEQADGAGTTSNIGTVTR